MTAAPSSDALLALLAGLLDDTSLLVAQADPAAVVTEHRRVRRSSPLVGALHVAVSQLGRLLDALEAAPSSDPVEVVLVADTGLVEAAEARAVLLDDDRVEPVGLVVGLPLDGPLEETARLTLESLDFALPAVVAVPAAPGWGAAARVVAEDGAERVGLNLAVDDEVLADLIVEGARAGARLVGLGGPWTVARGAHDSPRPGLLNLVAAAGAAVAGGDPASVRSLLAEDDVDSLLAALATADPRAVRGCLTTVATPAPGALVAALSALGIVEDEDS